METFIQFMILVTSLGSAWLLGAKEISQRRWGFVVSLIGQPFWFWTAWYHRQWGVLAGVFWFAFCGLRGIRSHFAKDCG